MSSPFSKNFQRFNPTSSELIAAIDGTKRLADGTKTTAASLSAQRENSKQLLGTSVEMIAQLGHIQDQIGMKLVTDLPLPTQEVRDSHSLSLGYVQLALRFLGSGVVHFMSQFAEACEENQRLQKHILELAKYEGEIDVLGTVQDLTEEALTKTSPPTPPVSPPASVAGPEREEKDKKTKKETKTDTKKDRKTPSK